MEPDPRRRHLLLGLLGGGVLGGSLLFGRRETGTDPRGDPDGPTGAAEEAQALSGAAWNETADAAGGSTPERDRGRRWRQVAATLRGLDAAVDHRGGATARRDRDPEAGAVFVDSQSATVYVGDGEQWRALPKTGPAPAETPTLTPADVEAVSVDPAGGYDELTAGLDDLGDDPGVVEIGPGRIDDVDGNVVIPSNTYLRGAGASATTLAFADGAAPDLAGLLRVEGENVLITDLELDGNRANVTLGEENLGQEYGFYTSGATDVTLERVYCHDFPGYGIDPHADGDTPSRRITVTDCVARRNGLDGFTFAGVAEGLVARNVSLANDRHGVAATDPQGDGVTLANNVSVANGGCGAVAQNRYRNVTIRANFLAANDADGIRIGNAGEAVTSVRIADNLVRDNGRYGVNLRPCREVTIAGNEFETNNRLDVAAAEIGLTASLGAATDVRIADNEIEARETTRYGVREREGNGPTTVENNAISGAGEPVRLAHPESVRSDGE